MITNTETGSMKQITFSAESDFGDDFALNLLAYQDGGFGVELEKDGELVDFVASGDGNKQELISALKDFIGLLEEN